MLLSLYYALLTNPRLSSLSIAGTGNLISGMCCSSKVCYFCSLTEMKALFFLFMSSFVEFFVASDLCGAIAACEGRNAWALSCGLVSSIVSGVLIGFIFCKPDLAAKSARNISIFLSVWWTFGLGFLTTSKGTEDYVGDHIVSDHKQLSEPRSVTVNQ